MLNLINSVYGWQWRGWLALLALAASLALMFVFFPRASARTGSKQNKVVDLQRAYTPEMFAGVLKGWSVPKTDEDRREENRETLKNAVGIMKRENIIKLDLVFPLLYALSFAFSYAVLSGRRQPTALDFVLFLTPFVAGLFDYAENFIHLRLLRGVETVADVERVEAAGGFSPTPVFAASSFAHAKYVLLGVSLLALVVALAQLIRARF